jgi:hypothetical protein
MLTQEEKEDNKEWEQRRLDGGHYTKTFLDKLKKEREKANKSRRTEEERPIPLLEFLSLTFKKHAMDMYNVVSYIEARAMLCIPRAAQWTPGSRLTRLALKTRR